jgi:hypothetical protein
MAGPADRHRAGDMPVASVSFGNHSCPRADGDRSAPRCSRVASVEWGQVGVEGPRVPPTLPPTLPANSTC